MADETLQAFQLGASLFDRAQTQARIMEQFNLQLADQAMRKRQADLQNKIQTNAYNQALEEQANQTDEYDAFQTFNRQVANFLNNATEGAAMPALPRFKSKQFNQQATQIINGLEPYSARAELIKKQTKASALADQLEAKRYDDAIKYNALTRTPDGKYVIDDNLISEKKTEQERLKKLRDMSLAGQRWTKEGLKTALDSGSINQEEYDQLLPTTRPEGGVVAQRAEKVLEGLKKQGIVQSPEDETNARVFLGGSSQGKVPGEITKAIGAANGAVVELDDVFKKLNEFENKYGKGSFAEYVGPLDNPVFNLKGRFKGLTSQEQKDARDIHSKIQLVVTDYQNNKYGATLTPSETANLEKVVSTPARNDYLQVISSFRNNLRSGAENKIWDYRFSPDIPYDIKKRYLEGARQKFGFEQPTVEAPATTVSQEQSLSPQDVFKNIRTNRPQSGITQPATAPAANRVGRFQMFIEGQ